MRIGYIISDPSGVWGGVRIAVEHLNRLADRGHEVWMLISNGQPMRWLPSRFNQAVLNACPVALDSFDAIAATDIGTWREAASDKYGPARRFALVQMLEHLFGGDTLSDDLRAIYSLPLRPLVISNWLANELESFNPLPAILVRNGLDRDLFHYDPLPDYRSSRLNQWPPRLLMVGHSQNKAKDVDEMAWQAIQRVKASTGVKLETWGFSQFAPRWPFDKFWMLPPQDTIRRIYSSCSILVIATRFEGDPGPDYEAMACGCVPCRAIGKGGEFLLAGQTCLKVEYGDLDGLTSNLARLITDGELLERLSKNGVRHVIDHRDWNLTIDTLEAALAGRL